MPWSLLSRNPRRKRVGSVCRRAVQSERAKTVPGTPDWPCDSRSEKDVPHAKEMTHPALTKLTLRPMRSGLPEVHQLLPPPAPLRRIVHELGDVHAGVAVRIATQARVERRPDHRNVDAANDLIDPCGGPRLMGGCSRANKSPKEPKKQHVSSSSRPPWSGSIPRFTSLILIPPSRLLAPLAAFRDPSSEPIFWPEPNGGCPHA